MNRFFFLCMKLINVIKWLVIYIKRDWRQKSIEALKDVDSRVFTRMLRKDGLTVELLYPFATSLARG